MTTNVPDSILRAGLRTRLISRLVGLSEERLRYWHESTLQSASTRSGSRGVPRLYNWVDYMRLRVIASLVRDGIPTQTIRRSVLLLDEVLPEWYLLPTRMAAERQHVMVQVESAESRFVADTGGQFLLAWPQSLQDSALAAGRAVEALTGPGASLGLLHDFADAVLMDPRVNIAKPTVMGTSLETLFVREMASDLGGARQFGELYRIDVRLVERAIEFEEAVA